MKAFNNIRNNQAVLAGAAIISMSVAGCSNQNNTSEARTFARQTLLPQPIPAETAPAITKTPGFLQIDGKAEDFTYHFTISAPSTSSKCRIEFSFAGTDMAGRKIVYQNVNELTDKLSSVAVSESKEMGGKLEIVLTSINTDLRTGRATFNGQQISAQEESELADNNKGLEDDCSAVRANNVSTEMTKETIEDLEMVIRLHNAGVVSRMSESDQPLAASKISYYRPEDSSSAKNIRVTASLHSVKL